VLQRPGLLQADLLRPDLLQADLQRLDLLQADPLHLPELAKVHQEVEKHREALEALLVELEASSCLAA